MPPHNINAGFINIAVFNELKQHKKEVNKRIPDDDLGRSKHVGLFLIKVF
jgi:hypothetical protein